MLTKFDKNRSEVIHFIILFISFKTSNLRVYSQQKMFLSSSTDLKLLEIAQFYSHHVRLLNELQPESLA